ncbi:ShlB/FhaC/HecB family hemolysin secretion/activation protein [Candidatus Omnitrophota bacterium]
MQSLILRRSAGLSLIISFLLVSVCVYAQTDVEQATRETDRFTLEDLEDQLKRHPTEESSKIGIEGVPLKKDKQKFFIRKIELIGAESFGPEEFAGIIAKYTDREVTLSELDNLTKELEQEHLRLGVIAAVFLPPQEIRRQTVTLQVVEARMGKLRIQDHKYFRKKKLINYWPIPEGQIIRYSKISKALKIMGKNPDREVKATLHAGEEEGATDILLTPETNFPIHLFSTYDREGVVSTGISRTSIGFRHNNFLGHDDMLLGGYSFGNNFSGKYIYHNIPISPRGAYVLYGFSKSESNPKKQYTSSDLESFANNASISLHQDFYEEDEHKGELYFGFNAKDKTVRRNTGVYTRDKLRIFRLGGSLKIRRFKSLTTITPEFSQGVDTFGATRRGNPLASRGAKTVFSKINLKVLQKRNVARNLQLNLKFEAQTSSTKLTPQEQFRLGGIDSIRGYPPDDYLADNAILASAELLIPSFFIPARWRMPFAGDSLREQTTALVFLDYGYGERRGALPTEEDRVNFLGAGAGLRIRLFNQVFLRLEWGIPVADGTITEANHVRFHFSVNFQENLPREIKRIVKSNRDTK